MVSGMTWTKNEVNALAEAAVAASPSPEPLLGTVVETGLHAIDAALQRVAVRGGQEVVLIAVPEDVYDDLVGEMLEEIGERRSRDSRWFDFDGSAGGELGTHLVYRGFGWYPYPILPTTRSGPKRSRPGLYGSGDLLVAIDFRDPLKG